MTEMANLKSSAMSKEVKLVKVARPLKEKDEKSAIISKKPARTSSRRYVLKRSIDVLQGRVVTNKAAQAVLFVGKVVVLEALRRLGHTNLYGLHRPLLWTLQGLSGLNCLTAIQVPPFVWLQRWAPFRFLAHATEGFSNPILFLSLAGVVTNAYKQKDTLNPDNWHKRSGSDDSHHKDSHHKVLQQETVITVPSTLPADDNAVSDPTIGEVKEEEILITEREDLTVEILKEELEKNGVTLPEWFDDDQVQRFWGAAHGDTTKFVTNVKKTIRWRKNYHFLSQSDLQLWEHLVFWHKHDDLGRPTLVIRLGLACSTLSPSERPLFVQAIVSQVEYGLRDKVARDDARLTAVMDCQGTSAIGFPLNMVKSCSVLVQENYPMRLAALFVINLPPIVQVLTNAVLQVVKPSTKKKVQMEGDKYMNSLATHLGGVFNVPVVLGGKCSCDYCENILTQKVEGNMSLVALKAHDELEQVRNQDLTVEERALCLRQSTYESYSGTLRVVITGLFLLWVVVAMISGYGDTYMYPT